MSQSLHEDDRWIKELLPCEIVYDPGRLGLYLVRGKTDQILGYQIKIPIIGLGQIMTRLQVELREDDHILDYDQYIDEAYIVGDSGRPIIYRPKLVLIGPMELVLNFVCSLDELLRCRIHIKARSRFFNEYDLDRDHDLWWVIEYGARLGWELDSIIKNPNQMEPRWVEHLIPIGTYARYAYYFEDKEKTHHVSLMVVDRHLNATTAKNHYMITINETGEYDLYDHSLIVFNEAKYNYVHIALIETDDPVFEFLILRYYCEPKDKDISWP